MPDFNWMKEIMAAGEKLNSRKDITDPAEISSIFELLERGVKENQTKAYRHLARCYEHGFGTDKNPDKAFELMKEAADLGDISAAYYVGWLYKYGFYFEQDSAKSGYYYNKALSSGNQNAIRSGRRLVKESDYFLIDFSPKKDILLRNDDGTLSPMDEPYFRSERVSENVWKARSAGDYCYVIKSGNEAIVIDCGYGAGNIRKYMEEVCGAEIIGVCNTHDHFDHTSSNAYFDKCWMSEKSAKYAVTPFASFVGIDFFSDVCDRTVVKEKDLIPFGNNALEVISIADHAPGSLMYLDVNDRILFTGDELFPFPEKSLNYTLKAWTENLKKLEMYLDRFDVAYGGGGRLDKDYIRKFISAADYAYAHPEEAEPCPPRQPRPNEPEKTTDGRIIYDRVFPHPGDSADGNYSAEDFSKPVEMVGLIHDGIYLSWGKDRY